MQYLNKDVLKLSESMQSNFVPIHNTQEEHIFMTIQLKGLWNNWKTI